MAFTMVSVTAPNVDKIDDICRYFYSCKGGDPQHAKPLHRQFSCPSKNRWRAISLSEPQGPQAQCEHGRQKYKDLYGNPDKKLKKIIVREKSQLKSLTLLPLWIASFLCGFFPDPTRFEPFFNFWVVNCYDKIQRPETKSSGATNLSQISLDKMFPQSQLLIRIN